MTEFDFRLLGNFRLRNVVFGKKESKMVKKQHIGNFII